MIVQPSCMVEEKLAIYRLISSFNHTPTLVIAYILFQLQ